MIGLGGLALLMVYLRAVVRAANAAGGSVASRARVGDRGVWLLEG